MSIILSKKNISLVCYLPLIFFFLPAFSFPFCGKVYSCFYISIYIAISVMFYLEGFNLINRFINICKKTPFIHYVVFIILGILGSFILVLCKIMTINQFCYSIIIRYIFGLFSLFLYFMCCLTKYMSLNQFARLLLIGLWINAVLGIIAYIARWFDISIINSIFDMFNNVRALKYSDGEVAYSAAGVFESKKRLCGLYSEPGYLAQFIFLFLPFVYTFAATKVKIFKSANFDFIFKRTIIPLSLINLILTFSPINFLLCIFFTIMFYFKSIIIYLKKYFISILLFFICIILFMNNYQYDVSNLFISRIFNVLANLNSIENLIAVDGSFATRVIGNFSAFRIFLQHPILGTGIGTLTEQLYFQYLTSPIPLTSEIIYKTITRGTAMSAPIPCFYSLLAEHGIFVTSIFFYFIWRVLLSMFHIYKKIPKDSFMYLFTKSLLYSLFCIIIEFFYEGTFILTSMNVLIAIYIVHIYLYKLTHKNKLIVENNTN